MINKRVLLTGYRGFIGQHMLKHLLNKGHLVSVFEWGDPLPVIEKGKFDVVIHMGAISSTVERDVEKVMTQNYDFSVWLYEECKKTNTMMQYSSSASVYGLESSFKEDAPPQPMNPYAWSKYLFERYVRDNPRNDGNYVQGFRYFNVYGPDGEEHKGDQASPFFKFKKQFEETGEVTVFEGSDEFKRDFIHVYHVVNTHAMFSHIPESGVWNVGTGKAMSFVDVARLYTDNIRTIPMPDELKTHYQKYTCADMTKTDATILYWN